MPSEIVGVYFDSCVLIGHGWPRFSARLNNVLELARGLGVGLILPEPVEAELETQWLVAFDEAAKVLNDGASALRRVAPELDISVTAGSREAALAQYRSRVEAAKSAWGFQIGVVPPRTVAELVDQSARHGAPFPTEDKSFRDAVILLAVVESMRPRTTGRGVLISTDKFFVTDRIRTYLTAVGNVEIVSDLAVLEVALVGRMKAEVATEYHTARGELRRLIEADLDGLSKFVEANLVLTDRDLALVGATVRELLGVAVEEVSDIVVPVFTDERHIDHDVSFEVVVGASIVLERFYRYRERRLRVGTPEVPEPPDMFGRPRLERTVMRVKSTVDARAKVAGGKYVGVEYQAASPGRMGDQLLRLMVDRQLRGEFGQ